MDKFTAMQAFVRVVEAGNFTKAADTLAVPKPTVTRLIQTLEAHLETKLLNRTTRRVTVTPDGAAYYERAVRLLGDVHELESSMSRAKQAPSGRLRVDVGAAIGRLVIIPALMDFHVRYPDIQIDLGVSDRPVDIIEENVDCVLRAGELTEQSLVARRIAQIHFVACASPAYLKQYGMPKHPRDLEQGHRMVGFFSPRTRRAFPFDFTKDGERIEFVGRSIVSVNDSNAYLAAGLAGLGVMQTAASMVKPYVDSGELVPVLPEWSSDPLPLYVVYPPNRHLSAKVRVFVDWVADLFAKGDMGRPAAIPARAAPPHQVAIEAARA